MPIAGQAEGGGEMHKKQSAVMKCQKLQRKPKDEGQQQQSKKKKKKMCISVSVVEKASLF